MKRSKRINSSGMFLTELIFAVLFFALASAVCLQIFAKAHSISQSSVQLNRAVLECSSAAELVLSVNSPDELYPLFCRVYPQTECDGDTLSVYFDTGFQPCDKSSGSYVMRLTAQCDEQGISADIAFLSGIDEVYSLPVFRHLQRRAA